MSTQKIKDSYSDDVRLALLEQSITNINDTLIRFEKRFDHIEKRFDYLDAKIDSNHKWTLGLISGLYLMFGSAFVAVIIKLVH